MTREVSRLRRVALVAVLFLSGCFIKNPPNDLIPPRPPPETLPGLPAGPSLRVLVLGDWGTGEEGQLSLAEAIAETHGDDPPDLVLTVGDNFYPDGVAGPGDPLWESHFEDVYRGAFWDSLVFRPTLGNHDHYGRPDAQIEYSKISHRWAMPHRYYAFREQVPGGGSVLFLALDTDPILERDGTSGVQLDWADSVLVNTSDDWVIAFGHHPVVSGGWHRSEGAIERGLLPLLEGRTDLFAAGHNHSTELLQSEEGILQAVCGGGAGLDNARRIRTIDETLAAFTNGGWCFIRLWPDVMAVDLLDREGGLQFRQLLQRSRGGR
jgi:acid phosphatase